LYFSSPFYALLIKWAKRYQLLANIRIGVDTFVVTMIILPPVTFQAFSPFSIFLLSFIPLYFYPESPA
jgi:hypothetical protein